MTTRCSNLREENEGKCGRKCWKVERIKYAQKAGLVMLVTHYAVTDSKNVDLRFVNH